MNAEVYPGKDGWRFRVKGNNGEIMCVGEAYVRRIDCESALHQLFGIGQRMDVTIRNHSGEVVDSYQCGRLLQGRDEPTLTDDDEEPLNYSGLDRSFDDNAGMGQ